MHSNVSFKHSNNNNIVSQSNVVDYVISRHICLVLDFFQNSRFSAFKIKFSNQNCSPRLAIFGGFDNMVSISLKSWSFDLFCGLCIFAHLRLQTSFLWRWKMAGFCMIYALRICRFMAKEPPKHFSCSIFFCHFAKLSTPKTQLCTLCISQ
jgi:hypothetical protein